VLHTSGLRVLVAETSITSVNADTFLFADIAVATTDEVDYFSDEGKIIHRLKKPSANLRSLEYDPINQVLFISDDTDSNYSIFTLSLEGSQDLRALIQSK
jgi:hypothetical protein